MLHDWLSTRGGFVCRRCGAMVAGLMAPMEGCDGGTALREALQWARDMGKAEVESIAIKEG